MPCQILHKIGLLPVIMLYYIWIRYMNSYHNSIWLYKHIFWNAIGIGIHHVNPKIYSSMRCGMNKIDNLWNIFQNEKENIDKNAVACIWNKTLSCIITRVHICCTWIWKLSHVQIGKSSAIFGMNTCWLHCVCWLFNRCHFYVYHNAILILKDHSTSVYIVPVEGLCL